MSSEVNNELWSELRKHALFKGDFTLSSGDRTTYYVDVKRALMTESGFAAVGRRVAEYAEKWRAEAVGGLVVGAVPIACSVLPYRLGLRSFFVRDEAKAHGLRRQIEGDIGPGTRCLIVDDVVTSGTSTLKAIKAVKAEGMTICGVLVVVDRLAGGSEAIEREIDDAPYVSLANIDDVYPDRPDRPGLASVTA